MYIEPCCYEKQLTTLVERCERTPTRPCAYFASNSDWTLQELTFFLAHITEACELTLVLVNVDVPLLRTLVGLLGTPGIITRMNLITQGNQRAEITAYLGEFAERVAVCEDLIACRLIAVSNNRRHLVVQGSLNLCQSNAFQAFTLTTSRELYDECMEVLLPKIKIKRTNRPAAVGKK